MAVPRYRLGVERSHSLKRGIKAPLSSFVNFPRWDGKRLFVRRSLFALDGCADRGEGLQSGFMTGANHFGSLCEVVPDKGSHVWLNNHIGVLAPLEVGMFLDDVERTAQNIREGPGIFDHAGLEVNGDHNFRAQQ